MPTTFPFGFALEASATVTHPDPATLTADELAHLGLDQEGGKP